MRKILVMDNFMEPHHVEEIRATAAEVGFGVDFVAPGDFGTVDAAGYEVVYGLPRPEQLRSFTGLRWFCASFAGVDNYCAAALWPNEEAILTNSAGAYGVTIAEHVMMVTLMLLRQYPQFARIVARQDWVRQIPMGTICRSRVTIVGTGDIGTHVACRFRAMEPGHICGVRRNQKPAPDFDEVVTFDRLDEVLPRTDILILCVPSTPQTVGILSRERIALLPQHAIVINVGRGSAIDQDALMDALNAERIAGAALDVMTPEPLPQGHPLWEAKNVLITPHCAGNFSCAVTRDTDVAMFCGDLRRYAAGERLAHLVDRTRGY